MSATKVKNEVKGNALNDALPVLSDVVSGLDSKPLEISPQKPLGENVKLIRKIAGYDIDIDFLAKQLGDCKSLAGDVYDLAEQHGLGRGIIAVNGKKVRIPTPTVTSELLALGLLGDKKTKGKIKSEKVKAYLEILKGFETLGVIKR